MFGYIYKVTNKINNKIYIGKKQSDVFIDSYYGSGLIIKRAINKYGLSNFDLELIDIAYSLEELNEKEINSIKNYNSLYRNGNGYNLSSGGDGGNTEAGYTDEQKKKLAEEKSIRVRGSKNGMFGRTQSESSLKKMLSTREEKNIGRRKIKAIFPNGNILYFNSKKECMKELNINQKVIDKLIISNKSYEISKHVNVNKRRVDLVGIVIQAKETG